MVKQVRFWALLALLLILSACIMQAEPQPSPTPDPEILTDQPSSTQDSELSSVTLYLPNSDATGLETMEITISADAASLVSALTEHGALPEGTEVLSFIREEGRIGRLDLTDAFSRGLQSTGSAGELMYVSALVNTLLQALELEQIQLTCSGKIIETGHNYYDMPLEWFSWEDTSA